MIVPGGWGRAVWNGLIRGGARPLGLQDREYLTSQQARLSYPRDYPDTAAGRAWWIDREAQETTRQQRRPPAKRVPAVVTPGVWTEPAVHPFVVIRRDEYLESVCMVLGIAYHAPLLPSGHSGRRGGRGGPGPGPGGGQGRFRWKAKAPAEASTATPTSPPVAPLALSTYVHVTLRCVGGGSPTALSQIEAPREEDYRTWSEAKESTPGAVVGPGDNHVLLGWVTAGGFCLAQGRGMAIGLVAVDSLRDLQRKAVGIPAALASLVLLRNPRSQSAWPARLELMTNATK